MAKWEISIFSLKKRKTKDQKNGDENLQLFM